MRREGRGGEEKRGKRVFIVCFMFTWHCLFPFPFSFRAKSDLDNHIQVVLEWKDFVPALDQKNVGPTPLPFLQCASRLTHTWTHKHMHNQMKAF